MALFKIWFINTKTGNTIYNIKMECSALVKQTSWRNLKHTKE